MRFLPVNHQELASRFAMVDGTSLVDGLKSKHVVFAWRRRAIVIMFPGRATKIQGGRNG